NQLNKGSCALAVLEWSCLVAGIARPRVHGQPQWLSFVVESKRPEDAWRRICLLALSFPVRWLRTGHAIRRTGLEGPIAIFLAGAAMATWLSRDGVRALPKICRIVSALGFFYAVVDSDERMLKWVAAAMVLAACVYALSWPTQWDFRARRSPFQLI